MCLKEHVSHGVTPPRASSCFIMIEEQFGKNSTEVNFSEGCQGDQLQTDAVLA